MQFHASCAARDGAGVLLLGAAGSGKSDLVLRLLDRGFMLVADDRVDVEDGVARAPAALAGLLEIRGLGILRLPWVPQARLVLAVSLGSAPARLPEPQRHPVLDLPLLALDPTAASAPQRVSLALDCALGKIRQAAGAFAA
jgi:HPr kinase/phosphorylase